MITINDVKKLASHDKRPFVSLYVPIDRGPDARKNPIELKNAVAEAKSQLKAWPDKIGTADRFLNRVEESIEDDDLWGQPGAGLSLFAAEDLFQTYRAPVRFQNSAFVESVAHILPLLTALEDGTEFFVLAISQNGVRLLRGTRSTVSALDLPDAPAHVNDLFHGEEAPELQLRSTRDQDGGDQAIFHGHADTESLSEENILRFLRAVDKQVSKKLREETAPLLFTGDTSLFAMYEDVNTYPKLLKRPIQGNPDVISEQDLHELAWPLLEDELNERRKQEIADTQDAIGQGLGSTDLHTVIKAAAEGRVDRLLVVKEKEAWGSYNADNHSIRVFPERTHACDELRNLAAVLTLRRDGTVRVLSDDECPYETALAARFRF